MASLTIGAETSAAATSPMGSSDVGAPAGPDVTIPNDVPAASTPPRITTSGLRLGS